MKILFLMVIIGAGVSGCTTTAYRMNCDETCALQGMICTGQSISRTFGSSSNSWQYGDSLAEAISPRTVDYSSSSDTFHCAKDASKTEEIEDIRADVLIRKRKFELECQTIAVGVMRTERAKACERLKGIDHAWQCRPKRISTLAPDDPARKECESR